MVHSRIVFAAVFAAALTAGLPAIPAQATPLCSSLRPEPPDLVCPLVGQRVVCVNSVLCLTPANKLARHCFQQQCRGGHSNPQTNSAQPSPAPANPGSQ